MVISLAGLVNLYTVLLALGFYDSKNNFGIMRE
jgi:hypothetical protein